MTTYLKKKNISVALTVCFTTFVADRGHNYQWKMPRPSSEVLLDRFETAHHDQIFMTRYTVGSYFWLL